MPAQSIIPPEVLKTLQEAEKGLSPEPADIQEPTDQHFKLAAGYLDANNQWHTDFVVRELTGRDEEAIGKTTRAGTMVLEIINRGLVSVGPHKGSVAIDGILGGDWETVLLAIRTVTFGNEVEYAIVCHECQNDYEATIHLDTDIPRTTMSEPSDIRFTYTGRHGDEYEVAMPLGVTHRKMLQNTDRTVAEQNSILLRDCVERINNRAALPEQVMNMPLVDRRNILNKIIENSPGPMLEGVRTLCPNCGVENLLNLNIAAMFR